MCSLAQEKQLDAAAAAAIKGLCSLLTNKSSAEKHCFLHLLTNDKKLKRS
jgi:hypothetical protein